MKVRVCKPKESYKKQNRRDLDEKIVHATHASAINFFPLKKIILTYPFQRYKCVRKDIFLTHFEIKS